MMFPIGSSRSCIALGGPSLPLNDVVPIAQIYGSNGGHDGSSSIESLAERKAKILCSHMIRDDFQ